MEKSSFLDRKSRGGKSIWEWMQVFIVPFAIALFTVVFSVVRSCSQRQIEDQRAQDAALQSYLDQMSMLLMERDLRASKEGSQVRILARARTLTVLERLDTSRKAEVMQFLVEANLLQTDVLPPDEPPKGPLPIIKLGDPDARTGENVVDLSGVDLSGAYLSGAYLYDVDLSNADLYYAQLNDAFLNGADLSDANLRFADMRGAYMAASNLIDADLYHANLDEADLSNADLSGAYLSHANLDGSRLTGVSLRNADLTQASMFSANLDIADLSNANLYYAHLTDAKLTDAEFGTALSSANLTDADLSKADLSGATGVTVKQLEREARSLKGATMPDGSKHP